MLSSAILAGIGHAVGIGLARAIPAWRRHQAMANGIAGAALIVGFLVALVSIPLAISMVVAILTVQGRYGFSSVNTVGLTPSGPVFAPPGYEINLLYIVGLLAMALSGPTALSIDHLLWRPNFRGSEPARPGGL